MTDTEQFTEVEQKYFESRGASPLLEEEQPKQESPPEASTGDAATLPKAAEVPAEESSNVEDGEAEADNPGKFVRHGAFHEERMRRKEVEGELARLREQTAAERARLEERLNHIANAMRQPEAAQQPLPPDQRLARLEAELQQSRQAEQQRQAELQARQQFEELVTAAEVEFSAKNADYEEAVAFAREHRLNDYLAMGVPLVGARALVEKDVHLLTEDSLRRGVSPAERVYNYAKAHGFGAAKKEEQAPSPEKLQAESQAKLKTIAAGQQAGKSLGAAAGTATPELTLQTVANMSQEDFDKLTPAQWRKLMGGS